MNLNKSPNRFSLFFFRIFLRVLFLIPIFARKENAMPESFSGMSYSMKTMKTISKIWFDEDWIYGLGDDGKTYRQSLLWYSHLRNATEEQRAKYEISTIGIHWPELDEDVSFESFLYDAPEPTRLQYFFLTHPEINVSGFAQKYGYNASLLRSYIKGFKTPSLEREQEIMSCVEKLGKEYLAIS